VAESVGLLGRSLAAQGRWEDAARALRHALHATAHLWAAGAVGPAADRLALAQVEVACGNPAHGRDLADALRVDLERRGLWAHELHTAAADLAERMTALEEAAALTGEHSNHRSKAVAEFLVRGFEDDSLGVRARAAELIGTGQHVKVALAELTGALSDVRKALDAAAEQNGAAALDPDSMRYAAAMLGALSQLPDDRSLKAVLGFLEASAKQEWFPAVHVPGAVALIRLGQRDGVEWVASTLSELDPKGRSRVATALAERAASLEGEVGGMPDVTGDALQTWVMDLAAGLPERLGKFDPES
jgi:hypothetical protein